MTETDGPLPKGLEEARDQSSIGASDVRWQQRLQSYSRAASLLEDALARGPDVLNTLEKEGSVQRFKFTLELGWNLLKDYLQASGVATPCRTATTRPYSSRASTRSVMSSFPHSWHYEKNLRSLLVPLLDVDATSDTTAALRLAAAGLSPKTLALMRAVFQRYPDVTRVVLFGSRAKGTARPESDVDLALDGDVSPETVSRIAFELDDLPLPYRFDIKSFGSIQHPELRSHIQRVGIECYRIR